MYWALPGLLPAPVVDCAVRRAERGGGAAAALACCSVTVPARLASWGWSSTVMWLLVYQSSFGTAVAVVLGASVCPGVCLECACASCAESCEAVDAVCTAAAAAVAAAGAAAGAGALLTLPLAAAKLPLEDTALRALWALLTLKIYRASP